MGPPGVLRPSAAYKRAERSADAAVQLKKQTCGDERMEREIFMIQKGEGTILEEKSLSG